MSLSRINLVGPDVEVSVEPSLEVRVWTNKIWRKWLRVLEQYLQALEKMTHGQNLAPFNGIDFPMDIM